MTDNNANTDANGLPMNLLQYEVGEVCKCYFTEINRNVNATISQQINKCQAFCRILQKDPNEIKEYLVEMFDAHRTKKRLPGRCLRKVKLVPYSYEEAVGKIGEIIESNDMFKDRKVSMMVSVVEDSDGDDDVMVNSISVCDMMDSFHYSETGAPFCNVIMMKADEAFSEED